MERAFRQPSTDTHRFSDVPQAEIQRSAFRRSRAYKSTFDAGYLIPIFADEALPGDTFKVNMSTVARLATPLLPIMDNIHMDFFFFFVPNRLLWEHWQEFCGERKKPADSIDYVVPQVWSPPSTGWTVGSLGDYFGIPTQVTNLKVNALHFRAYNMIWNEWFRDQNLMDSVDVPVDDGPDMASKYVVLRRCKRHDYFTSALPWPQKGAGVELPLGTSAPVKTGADRTWAGVEDQLRMWSSNSGGKPAGSYYLAIAGTTGGVYYPATGGGAVSQPLSPSNLYADLSNATAATINSLREAFQLQRMLERDARSGTRYTEVIRSHFGVESPDHRLQRPEYLGGGTTMVNIAPVAQTSEAGSTPQGKLAAIGYQAHSGIGWTKSFVEHGVIVGLVSVRADLTYQTGIDRMWSRRTRYDFYWPALAHLGEQEVRNDEIFASGVKATDEAVWGYQERWAEYRYAPSKITGQLRSSYAMSLDAWHLSQDFASLPGLNAAFMQEDPPIDRVIAVPSEPHFVFDGWFDVTCVRPMPTYSVPGLIDHF